MELKDMAESLHTVYDVLDYGWEGYDEELTTDDLHVAVAAMIDYLDGVDGPAAIDLPNAGLKVQRDEDGEYHLWFYVGEVDIE